MKKLSRITVAKFLIILSVFFVLEFNSETGLLRLGQAKRNTAPELNFELKDVTNKLGIKLIHRIWNNPMDKVHPWTTSMGAHLSVVDFDSDGWMDFFVGKSGANSQHHLLKNINGESFEDVTESAGLNEDIDNSYSTYRSIFFDCDNDGDKDLFLQTTHCPRFFVNQNGKFTETTKEANISSCFAGFASNVIDYDNDGLLDVIYASYNESVPEHSFKSKKKGHVKLFRNKGSCQFEDRSDVLNLNHQYTISVGVADLNNSGKKDLWFASDFSQDRILFGQADGSFKNVSSKVRSSFSRHGMSAEISYLDNSDYPSVYVSHVIAAKVNPEGNSLWSFTKDGNYKNVARDLGVARCGFSWGSKFIDINNDSNLDILVANGFISGDQASSKDYTFKFARIMHTPRELMVNPENWPSMRNHSMFGNQRSCLFLSDGEKYRDVAEHTGLKENLFDGRAISAIDFKNNGSVGFLIASQKGPVRAYSVEQKNDNNWIGFQLTGQCSNRDAIGTKIVVHSEGKKITRELQPLNGTFSQSDPRVHVGLGKRQVVEKVEFSWPSGFKQTLDQNFNLNSYQMIKEDEGCKDVI